MHIYVNGRNIEITDAIKAYVKEKFGKVATHYDQIQGIDVVLSVIKNPSASGKHVAEVSCKMATGVVRCEEAADSMYESIDLLADKLARQVQNSKTRVLVQTKLLSEQKQKLKNLLNSSVEFLKTTRILERVSFFNAF